MSMDKSLRSLVALAAIALPAIAVPPDPPIGKRWVLNEQFSDEFNGSSLDSSKWNDYHPNWRGRAPGLFVPENVSVGGGYLMLKGGVLDPAQTINGSTFDISCAAVTSKEQAASYGYYECRFKAGQSTLSGTFWMSSYNTMPGPEGTGDKYSLELDIQECIGKTGAFSGSYFASGMHCNGHFWYTDGSGYKHNLTPPSVEFDNPDLASADFNTYGCWWRDASGATFYYNDGEGRDMTFMAGVKADPFDFALHMNMVVETYPYPWISLPDTADLLDPTKNTAYYDWVRSYLLVDVDEVLAPDAYAVLPVFLRIDEESSDAVDWKSLVIVYSCNAAETVQVTLRDGNGQIILQQDHPLQPGLGRKALPLLNSGILNPGENYSVEIEYTGVGSDSDSSAYILPIAAPAPAGAGVVVFTEDFEGATVGATSGSNQQMPGTQIRTENGATGKIVAAPAAFTSGSGNAMLVSIDANTWARIATASTQSIAPYTIATGDVYRLEFDLYMPSTLARPIGEVFPRWRDSLNTGNGASDDTYECLLAGVHRLEYTGTFPVDMGLGDFMPTSVAPLIQIGLEGAAATDFAYIDNIRLVILPPRITPTTIWGEDFDSLAVGTTSGTNETLAGTGIQTANALSGKVVVVPPGFSNAVGNVLCLSTGGDLDAALRSVGDPIDLGVYNIQDGDSYSLSFDLYIPTTLSQPVGSVNYQWKGPGITNNGPDYAEHAVQTQGMYHVNYTGTFPINEGSGSLIPDSVRPSIHMDLDGLAASDYVYVDNVNFQIGPNGTGLEGYELFENEFALVEGPLGDDDNDGLPNWVEMAWGGHPVNGLDQGFLPMGIYDGTVNYTFVRRKDAYNGLAYRVIESPDLGTNSWSTFIGTETIDPLSDEYEMVTMPIPATDAQQFFRTEVSADFPQAPPPEPSSAIEFTAPDYYNGVLNGQQNWNAESGWLVGDVDGAGQVSTTVNSEIAVWNEPIQLALGESISFSVNLQFGGSYSTPSAYVYAFLGGLKPSNAAASVGTGEATAADANIQIITGTDNYRLLNNYAVITGASNISSGQLNSGDVLQFDYVLTLGADAASTSYTVRLRNLTDGTDTGIGTVTGVDASVYSALTGSGAYGFFQTIAPGNGGSGLSGVQVNSVSIAMP